MKELRGSSRGSRTAAVVILVAFLQVLVVAILGLGAITRDRREGHRQALDQADERARLELLEISSRVERDVLGALDDASRARRHSDLVELREGYHAHAAIIRDVYLVGHDGAVYWMDQMHRLHVPDREREALIRSEHEREAQAARHERADLAALPEQDRFSSLLFLVEQFPYRMVEGYPKSVGHAHKLVDLVEQEGTTAPPEPIAEEEGERSSPDERVRRALLAALEVAFLNAERPDLREYDRPTIEELETKVARVVAGMPEERRALRGEVEAYREARRRLDDGFKGALRLALATATGEVGAHEHEHDATCNHDEACVLTVTPHLLGVLPNHFLEGHFVTRLDAAAVQDLVEHQAHSDTLSRAGIEAHVVPSAAEAREEVVASHDFQKGVGIPFRIDLVRHTPFVVRPQGPAELFYWGIVALSGAGLVAGGIVLVRLYTREVRLARLKADFVSNLSHELKTPITSISMFTEMLQDGKLDAPDDRAEAYGVLAQEALRLQGIVGRMLDVARREARGVPYDLSPQDLNEPVGEAVERFQRIVADPGLTLAFSRSAEPLVVLMDRAAITDVVNNLISNAWKYRRDDTARIEVRTARRGRKAELVVADDGIGIPRSERRRVFQMFYRAEAYLTRAVPGTGLGLALVRTIVRAHRGTVRIESAEQGPGTVFRLRFPLTRAPRAVPVPAPTPSPKPEAHVTT
jgi:two-component system phosphate regulon sensor histidine kinase PhoR